MSTHGRIGDDGCSVMDCPIYNYAQGLARETQAPTVLKPCTIDGKPHVYCVSFPGDGPIQHYAHSLVTLERVGLAVGLLKRAKLQALEVDADPNHPARTS